MRNKGMGHRRGKAGWGGKGKAGRGGRGKLTLSERMKASGGSPSGHGGEGWR